MLLHSFVKCNFKQLFSIYHNENGDTLQHVLHHLYFYIFILSSCLVAGIHIHKCSFRFILDHALEFHLNEESLPGLFSLVYILH